jgi:HSP20 family protein
LKICQESCRGISIVKCGTSNKKKLNAMLVKFNKHRPAPYIWGNFDQLFTKDFPSFFDHSFKTVPSVNVKETNESFHIELAAPGMKKEDFNIRLNQDMLEISSEKQASKADENEKFTRQEFQYSSFKRSFTMPDEVDGTKISASYSEGILKIDLPKKPESKSGQPTEIKIS